MNTTSTINLPVMKTECVTASSETRCVSPSGTPTAGPSASHSSIPSVTPSSAPSTLPPSSCPSSAPTGEICHPAIEYLGSYSLITTGDLSLIGVDSDGRSVEGRTFVGGNLGETGSTQHNATFRFSLSSLPSSTLSLEVAGLVSLVGH